MFSLLLQACVGAPTAPPLPPGLPADIAVVRVEDGNLTVGGTLVGPWTDLDRAPTEDDDPTLALALATLAHRPVLVDLPGDTPFWKVRKVLGSARAGETGSVYLSAGGAE